MTNIKLKRGYNINLQGEAEQKILNLPLPEKIAIKPTDFTGIKPKLCVEVGDKVKIGTPLFFSKEDERIKFVSTVSGKVEEVVRGERRVIQAVIVKSDGKNDYEKIKIPSKELTKHDVIEILLKSGLFPCFIQRPFAKVASPDDTPRDIFISTMDTAPLAADWNFIIKGQEDSFQTGLNVIKKLTSGKAHLVIDGKRKDISEAFSKANGVEIHKVSGPHPAGNVGIHIHHIAPIRNRNDIVWTCSVQSVILIGRLFESGRLFPEITVAVAGSYAKNKNYYRTILGASAYSCHCSDDMSMDAYRPDHSKVRYISGNVLTGREIDFDGYIGFYDNLITIIPERENWEFLGWLMPGFRKTSFHRTFVSKLFRSKFKFVQTTAMSGGNRPFIITGDFERVLPMDLYPVILMKNIITKDIEKMEGLGIYELAEEDVALCEYIDPSKNEFQKILREGMELIEKEG
ncbi:MAG: Na(+)-translocating NADH-quinone reductase subunit A [Spirochaetes bacterium]|nr:Na(+)-translocating NADH-quinone reductase subunit A [Spirochaetota bacterium]